MDQYFIGINMRNKEVIEGLLELGATLRSRLPLIIMELNEHYGFYDGEWFLWTDVSGEFDFLNEFLWDMLDRIPDLKYTIVYYQTIDK